MVVEIFLVKTISNAVWEMCFTITIVSVLSSEALKNKYEASVSVDKYLIS